MARATNFLTDSKCRRPTRPAAKPGSSRKDAGPFKLADGGGLYLLVHPADGARYWRMNFTFGGKYRTLAFGRYPAVTLAQARARRDEAREQIAAGIDPTAERRLRKLTEPLSTASTFEAVAREWFGRERPKWTEKYAGNVERRLHRDVFRWIGSRPVADVTTMEVLALLRKVQERGAIETAHRIKSDCSQVFKYAIETGRRTDADPTGNLSRGALLTPDPRSHAAITDPAQFGALLRAIDGYAGGTVVRGALRLAPLVFVRPGELRRAQWSEFDLDAGVWEIPADRMKRPKAEKLISAAHIVPLSRQAVAILRELHNETGPDGYVFPTPRSTTRPMSENAVLAALRALGYSRDEMTGHGFRAAARTMLVERLKIPSEIVEMQLAHAVRDANGRAYNRVQWIEERTAMVQRWADYLDTLRTGADIIPITRSA